MILFKFFILGTLTSLMFPPFFMLPLGFIIFPYLIKLISKQNIKRSLSNLFFSGFVYGLGFLLIFLSWIHNPFLVYENTEPFVLLAFLLPIFLSIFFGLIFFIFKFIKNIFFLTLIMPFCFILLEFIISNFLYGFPWLSYSLILSNNILGMYILKFFGTLTSGYIILMIFLSPTIIRNINKIKQFKIFLIFLPYLFVLILPIINKYSNDTQLSRKISLDIVQILSPINNLNKKQVEQNILNIIQNSSSDYVVFAENNFPYLVSESNFHDLTKLTTKGKKIIIGATREDDGKFYNSFFLLEDKKIQYFDKKILVPFGEFLPLRNYLKFMESISGSIDFEAGNNNRIISTKDSLNILPIICYEIIFDKIFKKIETNKIDILINITNDAWFGNKIGPYQHFYITRAKSLIANKTLVRVSNNGISAVIDSSGKIIKPLLLNEQSTQSYKFEINKSPNYYLIHKFFSLYLILHFLILLILNRFYNNEKK